MSGRFELVLVDKYGSLVDAALRAGWTGVQMLGYTDVVEVPRTRGTAFVSPANSLGFMDGGIDFVLSRVMFQGVEARVKASFARHGSISRLGRPFLPVGSATVVPAYDDASLGVFLIAAPTMWLPQDVRGTRNAYHAMLAVLNAAAAHPEIRTVVVPGLCTRCGMMPADEAIAQMRDAHQTFGKSLIKTQRFVPPRSLGETLRSLRQEEIDEEQPMLYQNTEFKHIDPAMIHHV